MLLSASILNQFLGIGTVLGVTQISGKYSGIVGISGKCSGILSISLSGKYSGI